MMSDGYVPTTHIRQGEHCPTCHQKVLLSNRYLYDTPARLLIAMYRTDPHDWIYVPDLYRKFEIGGGDTVKPRHWKMIEPMPGERNDGSNRNGYWRLRARGRNWVRGKILVPRIALVYNNTCFGYKGGWWHITQALGEHFDYHALMNGDAP